MKDYLIARTFPELESTDQQLLLSISEIREVESGQTLLKQGDINRNIFLVLSGLLRSFVITSEGKDRTILLSKEKMRTASFNSFLRNQPSEVNIEAIEPSIVLNINSSKFQKLAQEHKVLAMLEKKGMQDFLAEAAERLHHFTTLTPVERYRAIIDNHPDLIQRVPQKYLASYLGITTVSLSRIRSRSQA